MRKILLPLLLAIAAAGCGATPFGAGSSGTVIRHGTSFGMCVGYCVTELAVSEREVVLTRTSPDPARFPTVTRRRATEPGEWEALLALEDSRALAALPEVVGCPDCADGGAEWVEVERDGSARRVTFEYRDAPEALARLVERLRAIRAGFPEP